MTALSSKSFQFVLSHFFHCQRMDLLSAQDQHQGSHGWRSTSNQATLIPNTLHVIFGPRLFFRGQLESRFTGAVHLKSTIGASLCDPADEGSGLRGCSLETSCASLGTRWPSGLLTVRCSCVCVCVWDLDMLAHAARRPLLFNTDTFCHRAPVKEERGESPLTEGSFHLTRTQRDIQGGGRKVCLRPRCARCSSFMTRV